MKIGSKLKELRVAHGYTQEELSTILNVSRSTISSWEINRTYPDISILVSLSELYDITIDQLINEDDKLIATMTDQTKTNHLFKKIILSLIVIIFSFTLFIVFMLQNNHQPEEQTITHYDFSDYSTILEKDWESDNSVYYYKDWFVEEIIDTLPDGTATTLLQAPHINTSFDEQVSLKIKRDENSNIKKVSIVDRKSTIQLLKKEYGEKIHMEEFPSLEEAQQSIEEAKGVNKKDTNKTLVFLKDDETSVKAYFKIE